MLAWENRGFSVDASVRITLLPPQVRVYRQPLEHLLRYCARPPFALERLSVTRGPDARATRVRYVLPRHKAANWVGPGRGRKSTRPGAKSHAPTTPPGLRGRNSWRGWGRSFLLRARGVVATSDSSRSLPIRGRSGRSSRIWESISSRRRSHPPEARPPTGVSSSRSMTIATSFKRRIDYSARDRYRQPLTVAGRKPPPRERRTGELGRGPRRREKNATAGGCALFWRTASGRPNRPISLLKGSPSAGRPLRKCH